MSSKVVFRWLGISFCNQEGSASSYFAQIRYFMQTEAYKNVYSNFILFNTSISLLPKNILREDHLSFPAKSFPPQFISSTSPETNEKGSCSIGPDW